MMGQKMAAKETKLSIEWYKWRAQVKREPLYRYLIMTPEILEYKFINMVNTSFLLTAVQQMQSTLTLHCLVQNIRIRRIIIIS